MNNKPSPYEKSRKRLRTYLKLSNEILPLSYEIFKVLLIGVLVLILIILTFFLYYSKVGLLPAATVFLSIATFCSVLIQWYSNKKRDRLRVLEKMLNEFYLPLFGYFKEDPFVFSAAAVDANKQVKKVKEEINRILFYKQYLFEFTGISKLHVFDGYFQAHEGKNIMNYSGWAFDSLDKVEYWRKFSIAFYSYAKKAINEYRSIGGNEDLSIKEPDWEKVFYLDEVKDLKTRLG